MFTINSITIYSSCQHKKNLEVGIYTLGKTVIKDFYGENITLHAIVGKNGSGKSSLLDIVLRLVNNFGAVVLKETVRKAAADLNYVLGLYADICYSVPLGGDREDTKAKLCCRNRALWLEFNGYCYWLSDPLLLEHPIEEDEQYLSCIARMGTTERVRNFSRPITQGQKKDLSQFFFYTVATNYSMLGFLKNDYEGEQSLEYRGVEQYDSEGKVVCDKDGNILYEWKWMPSYNWIHSLFHKNDGYMCPVVLNPFRNNDQIDMNNETGLTVQRLSALLISETEATPLLDGYCLDHIDYQPTDSMFMKFKDIREGNITKEELLHEFTENAMTPDSFAHEILNILECHVNSNMDNTLLKTALYIVYKVLNIAKTYPSYTELYKGVGDVENVYKNTPREKVPVVRALAQTIKNGTSHIEQKVHQACKFFHWAVVQNIELLHIFNTTFDYALYKQLLSLPNYTYANLQECMSTLPPAIFKPKIYVRRKLANRQWECNIPLWRLSSGERQFVYQMSTIVYHLHNLKSVAHSNMQYRNVNIVLDEMEICYHPDYQRCFISKLLSLLQSQQFANWFKIHILITTHSPFILSDVLASQIVYLEDGHQLRDRELDSMPNPFAANVNDVLHQSFFLHNGFIGQFAQQKILRLVEFLQGKETHEWNIDDAQIFISQVEEPYVKHQLQNLFDKHVSNSDGAERHRVIEKLRKEREEIQRRIDIINTGL